MNNLLTQIKLVDKMVEDTHRQLEQANLGVEKLLQSRKSYTQKSFAVQRAEQGLQLSALIMRLKSSWWSLQDAIPLLKRLHSETGNMTNSTLNVEDATRRATEGLTQIENTIAAAALRKYRALRPFIIRIPLKFSSELKVQVTKSWDMICALIEEYNHPELPDQTEREIVTQLANSARSSNQHRLYKELTSTASRTKELFYKQRIMQLIKDTISKERGPSKPSVSTPPRKKVEATAQISLPKKKTETSKQQKPKKADKVDEESRQRIVRGGIRTESNTQKSTNKSSSKSQPKQTQTYRGSRRGLQMTVNQSFKQQESGMEIRIAKVHQCFACVDLETDDLDCSKEGP